MPEQKEVLDSECFNFQTSRQGKQYIENTPRQTFDRETNRISHMAHGHVMFVEMVDAEAM